MDEKNNKEKKGGVTARIGYKFSDAIEKIKYSRLKNGKSNYRISTEKITNLIVKHNSWKDISNDIVNVKSEEIEEHGS